MHHIDNQQKTDVQTTNTQARGHAPAPTIAVRKSCNPDGIGLSHYVLMDRKQAK